MKLSDRTRFDAKWIPEPNTGCWLWIGTAGTGGYGSFGMRGKAYGAHRAAWLLYRGEIPAQDNPLFVCHICDVPPCVNPDHLFLGTHQDNLADMVAKGKPRKNSFDQGLTVRQMLNMLNPLFDDDLNPL